MIHCPLTLIISKVNLTAVFFNAECDQLMPIEDLNEEDDSPFPSLKEAEDMAKEASKQLCVKRNLNELPVHVSANNVKPITSK